VLFSCSTLLVYERNALSKCLYAKSYYFITLYELKEFLYTLMP